eukprot:s1083_g6.t1
METSEESSEMYLVPARDQVFLHQENHSGPWWLVRAADKQWIELDYQDPVLDVIKIGGAYKAVIDSASQGVGTRARFANKILRVNKRSRCSSKAAQICHESLPQAHQIYKLMTYTLGWEMDTVVKESVASAEYGRRGRPFRNLMTEDDEKKQGLKRGKSTANLLKSYKTVPREMIEIYKLVPQI